ncbi:hypothetical protein ABBQ32_010422 [Trebouxia sp. C0010 RCD-2024]
MATVFLALQQHQYMGQMSPQSPMYGSNSFGSSASTFHMSQSSGSPNLSYPYSHWYWPQPPSPPAAAPGVTPFMQAQYAPSNSFTSGSPGSQRSSGASPGSPGSHFAYSPTAAAAAAAAALHGHSVYSMSQPGVPGHSMYSGAYSGGYSGGSSGGYYHQDGLPGWQQGFFQGVGYGQPMRAYRSPSRTPSRSPPKGFAHGNSESSQHVSDMQTSSSQHMSESSSHRNPGRRSPLSRASPSRDQSSGQPPKSPLRAPANSSGEESTSTSGKAAPNSPPVRAGPSSPPDEAGPRRPPEAAAASSVMSAMPQADATVHVSVQRSFLAAVKQGSNSPPLSGRSPLAGKGSSPGNGMPVAYSASSEDGTSTSGMAAGDEAQCVDILEELCEMYRRQGALQNASSGLDRFQNAQQQLGDLAELMRSYGFPTPGWSEEDAEGPSDAADMAVDQAAQRTVARSSPPGSALRIPTSSPYKLNARQRRTLRRALDRARQAVAALNPH